MRKLKEIKKKFQRERYLNLAAPPGPFEVILILDNLKVGFNIGKLFRTAEVFGCREVHLIGTSFFDPYPSKGAFKVVPARFHDTFNECYNELSEKGYMFYCLDPGGAVGLAESQLPTRCAFVLGHEEYGFSFEPDAFELVKKVKIRQFGRTQSLNVAVAGSIAVYEYLRQITGSEAKS